MCTQNNNELSKARTTHTRSSFPETKKVKKKLDEHETLKYETLKYRAHEKTTTTTKKTTKKTKTKKERRDNTHTKKESPTKPLLSPCSTFSTLCVGSQKSSEKRGGGEGDVFVRPFSKSAVVSLRFRFRFRRRRRRCGFLESG